MKSTRWMWMRMVGMAAVLAAAWSLSAHGQVYQPSGAPMPMAETEAGNNLSFPVIWSDNVVRIERGLIDRFEGAFTPDPGDPFLRWYHQQDPNNVWQADNYTADELDLGPVNIDLIDWGDNLEARDWTLNSIVRVETVLYQDVVDGDILFPPMWAYEMKVLGGQGPNEMQGAGVRIDTGFPVPVTYPSELATVYSDAAVLTIQKLTKSRDDPTLTLTWNPTLRLWVGDAVTKRVIFNGGVFESVDGPGGYSAEVNVSGKVIYGYNWMVRRNNLGDGDYRITFSLDPSYPFLNTNFDEETEILVPEEGEDASVAEAPAGGGTAHVVPSLNLTYIDVRIVGSKGKGGGGGGGGGGRGPTD